jgi:Protein of unknown function (DUF3108)
MRSSARSTAFSRDLRRAAGVLGVLGAAYLSFAASLPPPDGFGPLPAAARPFLPKDLVYPVPFGPGETLVYSLAWLMIEGGKMTLQTSRESSPDGVGLHRLVLTAESNAFISTFYPVRTRYETWVDVRDFQPVRFEKHAREGRYESDEVEEFDLTRRVGSWRDTRTPLPERVQDLISSFYYLRTQPLVPGQAVQVDMYSRGKIYKLSAAVLSRERVETGVGVFEAFKIQPQLRENDSAEDRNRGKLFLWFSDDDRHLPVMARTVLKIGSVTARLRSVTPPVPPSMLPAPPTSPAVAPLTPG